MFTAKQFNAYGITFPLRTKAQRKAFTRRFHGLRIEVARQAGVGRPAVSEWLRGSFPSKNIKHIFLRLLKERIAAESRTAQKAA